MPKLSEVMGSLPQQPAAPAQDSQVPAPRMKLSHVMGGSAPAAPAPQRITDLPAVAARLSPQDDPMFTFPAKPGRGEDLLAWARFKRPELEKVPDRQLAAMIRREVYSDMDPVEFYKQTGFGKQFGIDTEAPDPTKGMSGGELFRTGIGSSLAATGRGIRQAITEGIGIPARSAVLSLHALGADDAAKELADIVAAPIQKESKRLRSEESETRRLEKPLMRTGSGLAGNITGGVVQVVAPGGALKLASRVPQFARGARALDLSSRTFLPGTVGGSAASGAAFGGVQPVTEDDSRAGNVALGATGGLVGAGIPRAVGGVVRTAGNLIPSVSRKSQERAAADIIEQFSQDPAAVRAALSRGSGEIVPGSIPTTAEITEDVGLAGLQRTLANTPEFGGELTLRNEAANRARVSAIESAFGGANAARADALTSARDLAARQSLRPIERLPVSGMDNVNRAVSGIADRFKAAPAVRDAMDAVASELPNIRTVQDAHFLRQYIGQLMAGQIEGKAGAKLAQSQLATVRNVLDRQMRQSFPEWGDFLRSYKSASREIGQVNVGEALLDKGPNLRAVGEIPQLSPAKFAGAASDMDRTVQQATGLRKAKAERALTPDQIKVVDEVRRDLERFANAQTRGKAIGSNTVQNAIGGQRVQNAVGPVGAAMIEPASGAALLALNAMRKHYGEKVYGIVREAMMDPNRAAEILSRLPPNSRRMIVRQVAGLISQTGGVAGRIAAPSAE